MASKDRKLGNARPFVEIGSRFVGRAIVDYNDFEGDPVRTKVLKVKRHITFKEPGPIEGGHTDREKKRFAQRRSSD